MGVTLTTSFNKQIGKKIAGEYHALGNGLERLDKVLDKSGLPTLGQFVSVDPEEWMDMDEDDPDAEAMPPLQWFEPSDGLIVIDAAIARLQAHPKLLTWSTDALAELSALRMELDLAKQEESQISVRNLRLILIES